MNVSGHWGTCIQGRAHAGIFIGVAKTEEPPKAESGGGVLGDLHGEAV